MSENYKYIYKIWCSIWVIILVLLGIWYHIMYSNLSKIIHQETISFQTCENYIFTDELSKTIKIQKYINPNDYKVLGLRCFEIFPNKRESFIIIQEVSDVINVSENETMHHAINIPDDTILEESEIFIEFKIPKANITLDVKYFGYSLWKIQNRDGTTRIWAINENIINESFRLDEIYYDENPEFIITNLQWNDLQVSYTILYNIENN